MKIPVLEMKTKRRARLMGKPQLNQAFSSRESFFSLSGAQVIGARRRTRATRSHC
jgi:hypothetical protein